MALRKPFRGTFPISQAFGATGLAIEPAGWRRLAQGRPWQASYVARPGWKHFDDLHFGTDWAMPIGTPVLALERGQVIQVGQNAARGRFVVVRIKGTTTRYRLQHLRSISVKTGQSVRRGQELGRSGNSGASNGPHLHVELWRGSGGAAPRYNIQRLSRNGDKAGVAWIVPA